MLDTYEGPSVAPGQSTGDNDVEMDDDTAKQQQQQQTQDTQEGFGKQYPVLIRATDGKGKEAKTKISTLVSERAASS